MQEEFSKKISFNELALAILTTDCTTLRRNADFSGFPRKFRFTHESKNAGTKYLLLLRKKFIG